MKKFLFILPLAFASSVLLNAQRGTVSVEKNAPSSSSMSTTTSTSSSWSSGVSGSSSNNNTSYSRGNDYGNSNSGSSNGSSSNYTYTAPSTNNNNNSSYDNNYYNSGYNNNNYYNSNNYNNNYNSGYYNNNSYSNYNNYNSNSNSTNYSSSNGRSYTVGDNSSYGSSVYIDDEKTTFKKAYYKTMTYDNARFYNTKNPINKFFQENQVPSQTFKFDSEKKQIIKGNSGAVLIIDANSFVTLNNEPVTGEVELELKEINNRSEMLVSNAHTVANNQLLISGGEIYMNVTQNGQTLMMSESKLVNVMIPANGEEDQGMETFYGSTAGGRLNWNSSGSSISYSPTTLSNTGSANVFNVNSTGWINADKFMRNNNPTRLTVHVPQQYDTANTAIFVVFSGQNTVTRVEEYKPGTNLNRQNTFSSKENILPVGNKVTIVAIAERNGQYYSSFNQTVLVKDHVENISFTPTSMDDFKKELDLLK